MKPKTKKTMKKRNLLLVTVLLAFALTSCGTTGEKEKTEKAAVECDQAVKDTCQHAAKDTCQTAHTEKADEPCDHDHEKAAE